MTPTRNPGTRAAGAVMTTAMNLAIMNVVISAVAEKRDGISESTGVKTLDICCISRNESEVTYQLSCFECIG